MNLPPPKTDIQDILLTLINNRAVSLTDYPHLAGFRTRISDIRDLGINFKESRVKAYNSRGRPYWYAFHRISDNERKKCIKVYLDMHGMNNVE